MLSMLDHRVVFSPEQLSSRHTCLRIGLISFALPIHPLVIPRAIPCDSSSRLPVASLSPSVLISLPH